METLDQDWANDSTVSIKEYCNISGESKKFLWRTKFLQHIQVGGKDLFSQIILVNFMILHEI